MESRDSEVLRRQAEKIIESGQLGKSELYPKLLLYLVESSRQGNTPKEIDIALDVFGKDESFNVHEDSIVRVYVHSLRGKLDDYYRNGGAGDEIRIEIPKGAYKIVAIPQSHSEEKTGEVAPPVVPVRSVWSRPWLIGLVAAILAVSAFGNLYLLARRDQEATAPAAEIAKSFVWADLMQDRRPITIVLGDVFLYSEYDPELGRDRYIGDIPINSREALRVFLKEHPDRASRLGPTDTTLLTKGTAYGLAMILPILESRGRDVKVTILDELDVDDIRNNDVIFIGPLHRLGPLAQYYDALSRYKYERTQNRLEDKKTGKYLTARKPLSRQGLDYGMFAKFRGPTDNRIMIFGSVASDIGLLQILHSMTSLTEVRQIKGMLQANREGPPTSFEALFSATGYERTDLAATVVDVHALKSPPADDNSDGF